jgi:hypothetical protein
VTAALRASSVALTMTSRMLIEFFMAERSLFGRHG